MMNNSDQTTVLASAGINADFIFMINLLAIVVSLIAMAYWIKIYRRLFQSNRKEIKGWRWLSVAILGILVFNISSVYLLMVREPIYELMEIIGRTLIVISLSIGGYLIYAPMKKNELYTFDITPVAERVSGTKSAIPTVVKKGQSYLLDEEKPEKSDEIFVNLVTHGVHGLYISRRHPREVREGCQLERTPIIWLTHQKTEDNTINPTDLVELSHTIKEFIKKTDNGVVLLDGVEYLITQNNYDEILKFIESLNDSIATSNSRLLVPLDHSTLSEQQFHILKREMKLLETTKSSLRRGKLQ